MAVDTAIKRISACRCRRLPWLRRFQPLPDNSVDTEDRELAAFDYVGILADPPDPTPDTTLRMDHRILANRRY
jgi:DNA gyrase inhibitor GyrI